MATQKQIRANQHNSQLGGVKTVEGKAVSRYNATKHGIFRQALTEYESELYTELLPSLQAELQPLGFVEELLVERIALCYLKLFRIARAENEFIASQLNGLRLEGDSILNVSDVEYLDRLYLRYDTTVENRLHRNLHELQRLQAARKDGNPLLPVAVDVNVHQED